MEDYYKFKAERIKNVEIIGFNPTILSSSSLGLATTLSSK